MSSVHLADGKPNWFCHYYDPEGFRRKASSGTENRRIAITICSTLERAAKLAAVNKLTNEKALKIIREAGAQIEETHGKIQADAAQVVMQAQLEKFVKIAGGELVTYSVRTWLDSWLKGKTDASKATIVEYRRIVDLFFKYLGARANSPLTTIQMRHIEEFKANLIPRVSPSTVNKAIKVLKGAFSHAVSSRQLEFSPAEHIAFVDGEAGERRGFTQEEIKKLLAKASDEWRTMILIGYYTGMRLNDCASLTWRNVELHSGMIRTKNKKTDRDVAVPIVDTLGTHLGKIAADDPDAPLCASLWGKKSSWLSGQFHDLMVDAGLVEERGKGKAHGVGRDAKRNLAKISFHSFRDSTTSDLKNAGVGEAVAMDIVGHDTKAMSRNYTKVSDEAKRDALNKLPDITK
jgi:integrase